MIMINSFEKSKTNIWEFLSQDSENIFAFKNSGFK